MQVTAHWPTMTHQVGRKLAFPSFAVIFWLASSRSDHTESTIPEGITNHVDRPNKRAIINGRTLTSPLCANAQRSLCTSLSRSKNLLPIRSNAVGSLAVSTARRGWFGCISWDHAGYAIFVPAVNNQFLCSTRPRSSQLREKDRPLQPPSQMMQENCDKQHSHQNPR